MREKAKKQQEVRIGNKNTIPPKYYERPRPVSPIVLTKIHYKYLIQFQGSTIITEIIAEM